VYFISPSLCLLLAVVMAEEALILGSFCFACSGELMSAVFASGTQGENFTLKK
jgi:hypothetical protein